MTKWHLVFTFPMSGSTADHPSRVVALVPYLPDDPNHGLPMWFFDSYTAPYHHEDGRITDEPWMYDSIQFWRDVDCWRVEWVPQMGPAPIWQSAFRAEWDPLQLEGWSDVLVRLADWQWWQFNGGLAGNSNKETSR